MNFASTKAATLGDLLRGERATMVRAAGPDSARQLVLSFLMIAVGAGLYGAAMGSWRGEQMPLYTAVKLPLILMLTAAGNALLNAMLAPLLGLNIRFHQAFSAIFMSYAITAAILGAFSPLLGFLIWNMTPFSHATSTDFSYSLMMLTHVLVIAFAGITGNLRLLQLLRAWAPNRAVALRVLFAWLAGNFLLGSKISWMLRPFIGSPQLAIQFYRRGALSGSFFDAVWYSLKELFHLL